MTDAEPGLAEFAGVAPGARVLDAAGGKGTLAAAMASAGARVVLLDRNAEALRSAGDAARAGAGRVRGDVLRLPFPAGAFDVVVLRAVLHHLPDPAAAIREAARAVRPGGVVVVVDKVAPEDGEAQAFRNAVERLRHAGHTWSHTVRELRNLAGAASLDVEEVRPWSEWKSAAEWIDRGTCRPPWEGVVRELLRADAGRGGEAFRARPGADGGLEIEDRWASMRLRKPEGRR
jgi:ArsR family transcriptional regulator